MDITSYILGKKAGGGGPAPVLQDKEVEITENGETTITADSGYDGLRSVDVDTNVQPDLETKSITITENTITTITPTSGKDGLSSVEITTDVQSGGGKFAPTKIYFNQETTNNRNTTLTISDLVNNIDFSNIDDMGYAFHNCIGLSGDLVISDNNTNDMSLRNCFQGCTGLTKLDMSNFTGNITSFIFMFMGCTNLKEVNLSNMKVTANTQINSLFHTCSSMEKIDIRSMQLELITNSNYYNTWVFNVPNDCLIIVRDNNAKRWVLGRNSSLTNVKTVAEYEGS